MKNERYSSYEELPLMLSAKEASAVLGISLAKTYELTKSKGFPVIKVGKRVLIPRDKLIACSTLNGGLSSLRIISIHPRIELPSLSTVLMLLLQAVLQKNLRPYQNRHYFPSKHFATFCETPNPSLPTETLQK